MAAGDSLLAPKITRRIIERFVAERPMDPEVQRRAEQLTEREVEGAAVRRQGDDER